MGGEDVNHVDPEHALANRVNARCSYNNLNSPEARHRHCRHTFIQIVLFVLLYQ
jgi:hypothetical protein